MTLLAKLLTSVDCHNCPSICAWERCGPNDTMGTRLQLLCSGHPVVLWAERTGTDILTHVMMPTWLVTRSQCTTVTHNRKKVEYDYI